MAIIGIKRKVNIVSASSNVVVLSRGAVRKRVKIGHNVLDVVFCIAGSYWTHNILLFVTSFVISLSQVLQFQFI